MHPSPQWLKETCGHGISCHTNVSMDFLIDGQISSFCPDQPEAVLLTLIMLILFRPVVTSSIIISYFSLTLMVTLQKSDQLSQLNSVMVVLFN